MRLAFVSGPYRDARGAYFIDRNIRRARGIAVSLWQTGLAVICPHLNTAFMDGAADDDVWLAGDLEMLRRCDLVVMVPGWQSSAGAINERAEAQALGLPVFEGDVEGLRELRAWLQERERVTVG